MFSVQAGLTIPNIKQSYQSYHQDETNNSLNLARIAHGDQMEDVKIANASASTSVSAKGTLFIYVY